LIKTVLTLPFGAGEEEKAKAAVEQLQAMGLEPESKKGIHAQTLKAWGKECLEAGVSMPAEIKIDTFPKAVIK
jgi:hypothetical protein